MKKLIAVALAAVFTLNGCATARRGVQKDNTPGYEKVKVQALVHGQPVNAKVRITVDGRTEVYETMRSPHETAVPLKFSRKSGDIYMAAKYQEHVLTLPPFEQKSSGWIWGNIAFGTGGFIAAPIDIAMGADKEHFEGEKMITFDFSGFFQSRPQFASHDDWSNAPRQPAQNFSQQPAPQPAPVNVMNFYGTPVPPQAPPAPQQPAVQPAPAPAGTQAIIQQSSGQQTVFLGHGQPIPPVPPAGNQVVVQPQPQVLTVTNSTTGQAIVIGGRVVFGTTPKTTINQTIVNIGK